MSEREEVKIRRYDACEMDYIAERENGDYVKYEDYIARLTTAERERDEARRERDAVKPMVDLATKEGEGMLAVGLELIRLHKELTEEREAVASFIAQNRALRHRAERAERVVEAARNLEARFGNALALEPRLTALIEAVRALDAQGDG